MQVTLPSRRGSDIDVMRLEGTFSLFGFEVIKLTDPDALQIENLFSNMRRDVRLASIACLVVCIMTHGDSDDNLFLHDRRSIALQDLRRLCFTPFLINKPRLFFVQACRGDRVLQPMFVRHDNSGGAQAVNKESDCLICCATVQGYPAMRSQSNGSWFISDLCGALQQVGHVSPIMRVLQLARRALNTRVDMLGNHFVMQAGEDTTTLLKDVQLLRGTESHFSSGCVLLMLLELLEDLIEESVERYCSALLPDSAEMRDIVRRLQEEEQYIAASAAY
ncbi:Caspase-like domain [Trinorchestia longiramus]|nr:Caspase-like domain [Trinorchestia longiramus]